MPQEIHLKFLLSRNNWVIQRGLTQRWSMTARTVKLLPFNFCNKPNNFVKF